MEPTSTADPIGESRLDSLARDFAAHIERLGARSRSDVTPADVLVELRDNVYPSLLALTEEAREIDGELAELAEPEPTLEPEHVIAIAAALRAGQDLAALVKRSVTGLAPDHERDAIEESLARFDASADVAIAVLHRVVTLDDESVQSSSEATDE